MAKVKEVEVENENVIELNQFEVGSETKIMRTKAGGFRETELTRLLGEWTDKEHSKGEKFVVREEQFQLFIDIEREHKSPLRNLMANKFYTFLKAKEVHETQGGDYKQFSGIDKITGKQVAWIEKIK